VSVAILTALYGKAHIGDWDGVAAYLSDDLVIHEAASLPFGGEYRGRAALRQLYGIVMAYWDSPSVDVYSIVGDETHVVALMNFTMTSKLTGNTFTQKMAEVSTLADGLVTEMRIHYYDTAQVAAEAGPPRAASG
jgi:ketosteroid isomerase-like protein